MSNLNSFFFSKGNVSLSQFLLPLEKSKEIAKSIFTKIENQMIEAINKETEAYEETPNNFIKDLYLIERTYLMKIPNMKNAISEEKEVHLFNLEESKPEKNL